MFEKIKYESSLVKKWFAQTESNENINEPGVIDIVLELMHHFDIKSNKRLLKRFEKYACPKLTKDSYIVRNTGLFRGRYTLVYKNV